jgi:hypothetical protein
MPVFLALIFGLVTGAMGFGFVHKVTAHPSVAVASTAPAPTPPPYKGTRWEYTTAYVVGDAEDDDETRQLGLNGWEAVGSYDRYRILFKRRLPGL